MIRSVRYDDTEYVKLPYQIYERTRVEAGAIEAKCPAENLKSNRDYKETKKQNEEVKCY